jgi:hypothetical protein
MVYSKEPLLAPRARLVCPTMELFHIYNKCLHSIWADPLFFFPYIAPLKHAFYPESKVKSKPHLKEIEIVFTTCTLIYPRIQDRLLNLENVVEGASTNHLRNLIIFFEFFVPVVLFIFSFLCKFSSIFFKELARLEYFALFASAHLRFVFFCVSLGGCVCFL